LYGKAVQNQNPRKGTPDNFFLEFDFGWELPMSQNAYAHSILYSIYSYRDPGYN
jgi:hypothetical protein